MNIDIIKNYTSSIKSFIENNDANGLLSSIKKFKDLSTFLLPQENNILLIQILSNNNFSKKDKIFIIKKLLKYKINIHCTNEFKQTPLHLICLKNIYELIPLFINQKSKKDIYGKYPFEYVFENFFLLKQPTEITNQKDFSITFDNLLYDSFHNIDYAISFSNILTDYDILKNNSIEIFTSIQNAIDTKSIVVEKDIELYLENENDWEKIQTTFWNHYLENIQQNKLYDKNNLKIPVHNIDLLNKMRESILLGYLQYSIKMYNNLTNINFNDITSIINKYDKLLTHSKAVFPRNNIINFQDNYFMKGHNYLVIIPMPSYIGDLTYNSLVTNYNYYNYKNWVVLKLFLRYNKNTQRIIDHFHQVFPEFQNILSNSSSLNWKELYWLLVSLPSFEDKHVSDCSEHFDSKYMQYLFNTIKKEDDNDIQYKMFEYDYQKSMNLNHTEENSYHSLYKQKYCFIRKTILQNYLGIYEEKELKYLQISFGFEMILLFHCLLNNEYDKSLNEFHINSSYNKEFMKRYYTHKADEHFTNVYKFKNHIDENRIKSSAMNMNELLISYHKNNLQIIQNEIFQKDEIIHNYLQNKDFTSKNYKWDDDSYQDIFVDFIMSKIKFFCTLKYEKVDISKLYYSKLNDTTVIFENLFNNLEHIVKMIDTDLSIDEKINFIKETISPQNHLYSFIVKFIKVENKMNNKIKNYILILLLLLSNLWNLSNSFKQFYFPQKDFNNNILIKLYNKIQEFYDNTYKNKNIKLNFFTSKNLKTFTDILKTKGIKETISSLSKKNDKYKLVYYLLINFQQFINVFANMNNSFFLLNLLVSIYGNIIDCYLDKKQMFKFNIVDMARKLQIDMDLIESLNKTEIITLSDILPVYLYILFNPNIIIDILKENENILFIVNNVYKLDLTLDDIKIIAGLITELKTLIFHSSNIYYLNGSFLNIMTYSCAASMKLCTLFFDDMENVKDKKDVIKKYYKLLSKYESILHQHEFMLMFNSQNVDLHLFLNHLSNISMQDCHIISVLMKVYGVHPKRQKIINEILDTKNFLIESGIDNQCINQIILQQVFYGVFFAECVDLNYINDTYSSYSYYYNQSQLSNVYGKNFHSQKFIIDKVLDTYSKHSNEKENKLHPFLDISNIYNTDKKIADIFNSNLDQNQFKNIGMNQTGQYIILIDNDNKIKVSHNYGQTFSNSDFQIENPENYNINIDNDGSKINFYQLTADKLNVKEIKNYGFESPDENDKQSGGSNNTNNDTETFQKKFQDFIRKSNKTINQEYIRLFLLNLIKNYYKYIFLDVFQIMYHIFDKIHEHNNNLAPPPANPPYQYRHYVNNIFNLRNNNTPYLVSNKGRANVFIRGNQRYIELRHNNQVQEFRVNQNNEITIQGLPPTPIGNPLPGGYFYHNINDNFDFNESINNHNYLSNNNDNFKNQDNNTYQYQYQHIFSYNLKSYIDMLINDIENNTDKFLEMIEQGMKITEHMQRGVHYYNFILLSYYDLLSFILNYKKEEINPNNNNNNIYNYELFTDVNNQGDTNLHKYTIFASHQYLLDNNYVVEKDCIINKNHLSNILHKLKNENLENITSRLNIPFTNNPNRFYNFNLDDNDPNPERFNNERIERYRNIIFRGDTQAFTFDNAKYLYNKSNNIQVGVKLSKSNERFNVDNEMLNNENRIYTYLLQIFVLEDNDSVKTRKIIYLSYIDNEKINDINFSINAQQIIISTTTTIAVSYDYGKKWDVDYLLHYDFLSVANELTDFSSKNITNKIYSANINSHTNYQYIIAKIDGFHKILIRNGFNKQIVKEEDTVEIKKYKFFSDIENMKHYDYHEINIPNKLNLLLYENEGNLENIKIISNFYHNRMIFKFADSVEFYYDHQFFYKEKIFYNPRKMEDDIYIVLKENPDVKDYIIGSRIDMAIVCIFKKIENLLVKIDDYTKNFYIELKKNYPDQQNNFIYLYSIYIEEVSFMINEIDILMKIIEKEKRTYEIKVNNLLQYVLNNTTIKTNSSFNDFKGLVERTLELIEIKSDIVDKKLYEEYLTILNKHLGVFNLYHYINKNNYYISRDLVKSSMIVKTFHSFRNTIEDFSTIDIIDENDVFLSYIKEKSIHEFLQKSKNIHSKDSIKYYKKVDLKIDEYLKFIVKNSLYNTIVYNNRFFLKKDASILQDEKKPLINFEDYLNYDKFTIDENKIFIVLPINNFITSDKWFIFQDLHYLDNHTLKKFIQKFYKHDKNVIKQIIPNIIDSCNHILFQFITNAFDIIGYDYNFLIKQKINDLKYFKKEMIHHFKSSFQEKFKKEFNLEEIYLDDYYDEILSIYESQIKTEINFTKPTFEVLLDIPLKIFSENNISKDDEYNLKLYNIFNYKLNENNIDTIEFNNYITEQLNNPKLYFILLNYLNDVLNIINNFSMIDINLHRLQSMLINNRQQNIKKSIN